MSVVGRNRSSRTPNGLASQIGRRVRITARRSLRRVVPAGSRLEDRLAGALRSPQLEWRSGEGWELGVGPTVVVARSIDQPDPRHGVFLFGACDMPGLLSMGPSLTPRTRGTVAIAGENNFSLARADLILQTLDDLPATTVAELGDRLMLPRTAFRPVVFEPDFEVPGVGRFPKSVVVLSAGINSVRPVYRHRESGLIVDVGGEWFRAGDRGERRAAWFREHFESLGRMSLDQFQRDFRRLVQEVRERTGAQVVAVNALAVEPHDRTHRYLGRTRPEVVRRIEFNLALDEMAADLGFAVVDMDRVLKTRGVDQQVDFAHYPEEARPDIAAEAFRILAALGVQ